MTRILRSARDPGRSLLGWSGKTNEKDVPEISSLLTIVIWRSLGRGGGEKLSEFWCWDVSLGPASVETVRYQGTAGGKIGFLCLSISNDVGNIKFIKTFF